MAWGHTWQKSFNLNKGKVLPIKNKSRVFNPITPIGTFKWHQKYILYVFFLNSGDIGIDIK